MEPEKEKMLMAYASAIVARAKLSSRMGIQHYQGNRDMNKALGYLEEIQFNDYLSRYKRQDIAKAVIDKPANATWQGDLTIIEANEAKDTEIEKQFNILVEDLKLKSVFTRMDKLSCLGKYGVLLLGFSDVVTKEIFQKPVSKGNNLKLVYVMPFSEGSAKINTYETNPNDKRFGMPLLYDIAIQQTESGGNTILSVHYSRLIHIVADPLESEIEGNPILEVVFNRLMDLDKIVGGDAEMFWRNARPGYQANVEEGYSLSVEDEEKLKEQLDEYENNLRRFLINRGLKYETLQQLIADPSAHFEMQCTLISIATSIPKRILMGSERGELSSGQDADEWDSYVQNRRERFAEPCIVRPFVDKLIELGILTNPKTNKYSVKWSDLFAESEKERVDIGKIRTEALKNYANAPAAAGIVPEQAFFELFLGLTDDQIDLIRQYADSAMKEEQNGMIDELDNTEPTQIDTSLKRTKFNGKQA